MLEHHVVLIESLFSKLNLIFLVTLHLFPYVFDLPYCVRVEGVYQLSQEVLVHNLQPLLLSKIEAKCVEDIVKDLDEDG